MHPTIANPVESNAIAYRYLFSRDELASLSWPGVQAILHEMPQVSRMWLGPDAHVVFYPVQDRQMFNLVFVTTDEKVNGEDGDDLEKVREFCSDWDPT